MSERMQDNLYLALASVAVLLGALFNLWLYLRGYKRGTKGEKMSNTKYILYLMFLTVYARGYSKGMQDYLLTNTPRQKNKPENTTTNQNQNNK